MNCSKFNYGKQMKLSLLPCILILVSTSAKAAPANLMCTEVGGTFIEEGDSILEFNGTRKNSYKICPLIDPGSMKYDNSVEDCHAIHLASSEAEPYEAMTIEFNWNTREALAIIPRGNPIYFTVEEKSEQYRLFRKQRPNTPQTYREGPYEEFTLIVDKPSLSFSFKKIEDRTESEQAIYTTITNGYCKKAKI